MQIRGATIKDTGGIAKVQVDSYRSAYAGIFSSAYLNAFTYQKQEEDWQYIGFWTNKQKEVLPALMKVPEIKIDEFSRWSVDPFKQATSPPNREDTELGM